MRKPENKLMAAIFCYEYGRFGIRRTGCYEDEELEESVNGVSLRDAIYSVLNSISLLGGPRQRSTCKRVLELRFGFIDGHGRTLKAIGVEFHVTPERIRQIEAKGLRYLRHPRRAHILEPYIKEQSKQ